MVHGNATAAGVGDGDRDLDLDTPNSRAGPRPDAGPDMAIRTTPSISMANGLEKNRRRDPAPHSHSGSTSHDPKWWKIRLFQGMINDIRRRAPYYWSDWRDALDYRVVPATVYMYFAKYENTHTHTVS